MTRSDYLSGGAVLTAKRGNDLPHARLTPEVVRQIRATRGRITARQWSEQLGTHVRTIDKVRDYVTWRHVK